jgi:hypothetical protein
LPAYLAAVAALPAGEGKTRMLHDMFDAAAGGTAGRMLLDKVAEHGSAGHPYAGSDELLGIRQPANLADAVHLLCSLHGRYPGLIDQASGRSADAASRAWFEEAAHVFAMERALLTRLAAAAGPPPRTPGHANSNAAIRIQRHAIETLAQSERMGCALGTALAFAADWGAVRTVLGVAAARYEIAAPIYRLHRPGHLLEVVESAVTPPPLQRALLFGAEQFALQHRGLWDLLEARAQARAGTLRNARRVA